MERIYPPRKSRPVTLALPKIETPDDIAKVQGTVIGAMAIGDITPEEASLERIPTTHKKVDDETLEQVYKLIDVLEEDDDVIRVFHNIEEREE